jgi:hypothetical protein
MPLNHVAGVDHVVVTVRDLDQAAELWAKAGFTLSPRGLHSAHIGTANYTIMLDDDYIELLGVMVPTDQNQRTRDFLESGEGIERTAFTASDAVAGAAEIAAEGMVPLGPVDFSRPVPLADGSTGEARFTVFRWPVDQNPGGMRIFACQHHTRETVWLPELTRHANGASKIKLIEIISDNPIASAAQMSRLIKQPARLDRDTIRLSSGTGRADFLFSTRASFAKRHPDAAIDRLPASGAIGLTLHSRLNPAPEPIALTGVLVSFSTE